MTGNNCVVDAPQPPAGVHISIPTRGPILHTTGESMFLSLQTEQIVPSVDFLLFTSAMNLVVMSALSGSDTGGWKEVLTEGQVSSVV